MSDVTVTLQLGDCLELLKTLPAGSVDAVVTDPPYGIDFKYNQHDDTPDGYGAWLWTVLSLAESKCKPGAVIFVWQAMLNVRHFAEWFPRDWRIFAACKTFVQLRPTAMQYAFDPVIVWWVPGVKPYTDNKSARDWNVTNTAIHSGLDKVKDHPCARPLYQIQHVIDKWVQPNGTVIDPFMGSGTTGVACVQTGRNFIGMEIDPGYFAIAQKRIAAAQLQPRLLSLAGPRPEQEPLP